MMATVPGGLTATRWTDWPVGALIAGQINGIWMAAAPRRLQLHARCHNMPADAARSATH